MKKYLTAVRNGPVGCVFMVMPASAVKPGPDVAITLLNPPPDGRLVLNVGESYTFDIRITSPEPFVSGIAKVTMYYPGKGVFWHASTDSASQATSALLHLTVIGKKSTAGLPAVCDWPTEGVCWPANVAPQAIMVGARFKGGLVSIERLPICRMGALSGKDLPRVSKKIPGCSIT